MSHNTGPGSRAAFYDAPTPAVIINNLSVADPAVVTEALRWSGGRRGEAVSAAQMRDADLTAFVTQSLAIGAHAITSAGGTQDMFDLERLVSDVGTRTTEATTQAVAATSETVTRVAEAVNKVAEDATKVITEASENARNSFTDTIGAATQALHADVQRLFGGENPELVSRLAPLLDSFGQRLDARSAEQTQALLAKAARQFDPSDPTSPMAKHSRALQEQQGQLTSAIEKNHEALVAKVDELTTAVRVTTSARSASDSLASVTPLKGTTYADGVHQVMGDIAAGLGDDYADTGNATGAIARSKKGDGVLTITGGSTRLVLEMTDSARTTWGTYLEEAERNRDAAASLGLVREAEQLGGHAIRCLGPRRIVLAFDPDRDDPQLLRTVVQLLRTAALAASSRRDAEDIQTAEEKLAEAVAMLSKIDEIRTAAGAVRKGADKIDGQCTALQTGLSRVLRQAQAALVGLDAPESGAEGEDQLAGKGTHSAA